MLLVAAEPRPNAVLAPEADVAPVPPLAIVVVASLDVGTVPLAKLLAFVASVLGTLFKLKSVFNSAGVLFFISPLSSTKISPELPLAAYVETNFPVIVRSPASVRMRGEFPTPSFIINDAVSLLSVSKTKAISVVCVYVPHCTSFNAAVLPGITKS